MNGFQQERTEPIEEFSVLKDASPKFNGIERVQRITAVQQSGLRLCRA